MTLGVHQMNIRPAVSTDDEAIWAMLEPVFRAGETYCLPRGISRADALAYWSGGTHDVFLAEDDGGPTGTYFICPNQQGGGAHVCNCGFVTADAARGKGVARAMLAHALKTARDAGYRAMQFNFVVATNTRAIAIWEDNGFDIVGRIPGAFNSPQHGYVGALVMYRQI